MAAPVEPRRPSLPQALVPVVVLVAVLATNVAVFGDGAIEGPNQLALLLAAAVAMGVGMYNGHAYRDLLGAIVKGISTATGAILILLMIGALAGTWLLCGTVPRMIDDGLRLLSPAWFPVAACLACAMVSLAIGSSWSTAATVGIALVGIGQAMGYNTGLVAGAVISGAYFGDKLSPLSDTTNLAPAVAGSDLFTHIRYLLWTTLPSMAIALVLFLVIGLNFQGEGAVGEVDTLREAIGARFALPVWLYAPPVLVLLLIWRKVPPLPALFAGTVAGALCAALLQPALLRELAADENMLRGTYRLVLGTMASGVDVDTGHPAADKLLSASGMAGMLNTVWLIVCAMAFGGAMEGATLLQRITAAVMTAVRGDASLVGTTAASCVFVNVTASDQYLSIVVPGRMYAPVYQDRGLAPQLLSRTLEDSGTVTSALVPWNTCGAYMTGVLGVATGAYLPYCFFNLASPLMTVLYAALGLRIARLPAGGRK
jgi:NhaC family Na+:H+ antiporter